MPLRVQRRDIILHDGFIASTAFGCEHIEVISTAVRFAVSFVEPVFTELLPALSTEEVFRVPRLLQRRHAFIEDGAVAVSASRREQIMVVRLAVWSAIALEEVPRAQLLVAVGAGEVFRVPRATQRCYDLPNDRLLAGVAASLLGRLYSLAAHVCPEGSEHMLERGGLGLARVAAVVFLPRAFLTMHVGTAFTSWAAYKW